MQPINKVYQNFHNEEFHNPNPKHQLLKKYNFFSWFCTKKICVTGHGRVEEGMKSLICNK